MPCAPGLVAIRKCPPRLCAVDGGILRHACKAGDLTVEFARAGEQSGGLAKYPGCRVEEGPCRGLLLAFVDLEYSLRGSVAASSKWGDWARAELEPVAPGLVRVRMECRLERAKAARLQLASREVTCDKSGSYEQLIDLRGSEWPALFVALYGTNGHYFLDKVSERDPCKGSCKASLTLDLPDGPVEEIGEVEHVVLQSNGNVGQAPQNATT